MNTKEFEYDAGLSFLHQDESVAERICSGMKKLKTFIYTRKQSELVGPDVEDKLKKAYGFDSRIVVVLYRKDWGKTPLTFVEEQAIRDRIIRGMSKSFLIVANMTGEEKIPDWLSGDRTIWYDYKRFGLKGLIATIEHKVEVHGSNKRPETIIEKAQRKKHEEQFLIKRNQFLVTTEGVNRAVTEFEVLRSTVKNLLESVKESYKFDISESPRKLLAKLEPFTFNLDWNWTIGNTLKYDRERACAKVTVFKRNYDKYEYEEGSHIKVIVETFYFNMFYPELYGWYQNKDTDYIPTNIVAENIVDQLLEKL